MNNLIVYSYLIYLPIAVLLTFFVAKTFFKNAQVFMLEIFSKRVELATSTNKLFEVGFYLVNLGFALNYMEISRNVQNFYAQDMFEVLSFKVGSLAIFLGAMVFLNLYFLFRGKKKSRENKMLDAQKVNIGQ